MSREFIVYMFEKMKIMEKMVLNFGMPKDE